jgi:hypothetical protein
MRSRPVRVYEKLDGSLMTLYWFEGQWRVASNKLPAAGGQVARAERVGGQTFEVSVITIC